MVLFTPIKCFNMNLLIDNLLCPFKFIFYMRWSITLVWTRYPFFPAPLPPGNMYPPPAYKHSSHIYTPPPAPRTHTYLLTVRLALKSLSTVRTLDSGHGSPCTLSFNSSSFHPFIIFLLSFHYFIFLFFVLSSFHYLFIQYSSWNIF